MSEKKKIQSGSEFCGTASMGERGQVVIPVEARKKLHLKTGDQLMVMLHHDAIMILPKKKMESFIKALTAKLAI